jgi:hypothetical protein
VVLRWDEVRKGVFIAPEYQNEKFLQASRIVVALEWRRRDTAMLTLLL